ncbi:MAG TPA: MoxR family ATPase [Aquabacterium sp.]|nr:MoxR family ATPase [Aquabacterium sp.]HQC96093.1 MoxR family ATPase [Aquabacterium sp.]
MTSTPYRGDEIQRPAGRVLWEQRPRGEDPRGYLADPKLAAAVNVALMLGKPLLLTGDPGTGKTRLADHVAMALGLGTPERFDTRSVSQASELFYRFDSLASFHAAHQGQAARRALGFISFGPLGKAILRTLPRDHRLFELLDLPYPEPPKGTSREIYPGRSVVLIDEIDKAPRDFPNDLLDAIDHQRFSLRELESATTERLIAEFGSADIQADEEERPVVIITSNSEKNLPDAFLRRCVYFHIQFPSPDQLRAIVARRMLDDDRGGAMLSRLDAQQLESAKALGEDQCRPLLNSAVTWFTELRQRDLRKSPATAELIEWVRYLLASGLGADQTVTERPGLLRASVGVLAKCREDLELALDLAGPAAASPSVDGTGT